MLINKVLNFIQQLVKPIYDRSFVLQKIDWLIGINIFLVIFSSTFAQSDMIANFGIFAILLTAVKLLTKTGEKFEMTLAEKFLLVYLIFVIISLAGSSLLYLSLKGFVKTLTYLGFYVSVVNYLKDNKDKIKYIFIALAICASYETFFAFLQNYGAVEEISGWQDMSHLNPEEVMTRVYGTIKPYNPNLFGGYMLSVIPAFLPLPFINKKLLIPSVVFGLSALSALVFTGCRGAYIGFFFEILLLIFIIHKLIKPDYKKIFNTVVLAGAVLVSLAIVSTSAIRARIFSIFAMRGDSSNSFRFNVYHSCIEMFKDNWLLGIGCGNQNFREIYGLYMRTGFDALSAYNIYLETAVESGIFALFAFVAFLVVNIFNALKYIFTKKISETIFVLTALVSLVGMLTHGFVDTVFFRPQIQFTFWLMVGIICVTVNNGELCQKKE
ncbi:O-antigen ligase family protein [bacterium]|nr:O-antigen ligase family protein [bacterium]